MQSGSQLNDSQRCIDARDRGLAYGDGLFETMLAEHGRVRWLDYHFDRLALGCARLRIPLPDPDLLRTAIDAELPPADFATVKLILTRGVGRRGYAPPADPQPTLIVLAEPVEGPAPLPDVAAVTLDLRLAENAELAGIKHLSRLEQVMAQLELQQRGAAEGMLRNSSGWLVGGTSSNVFAVTANRITTPRISTAGILGVMRRVVLETAPKLGIDTAEDDMRLEDLYAADEIFITNAVIGIRSVSALDGRASGPARIAARLRDALKEAVA